MKYWLLALLMSSAFAYEQPQSKEQYCNNLREPLFFQKLLQDNPSSRMSFQNSGGLFNQGVCWWHSLFQRNALYLTYYSPQKARPTAGQAYRIIKQIRLGRRVVEIPGFTDFYSFSKAYVKAIQLELNSWQIHDGVVRGRWYPALTKPYQIDPLKLKVQMDQLYAQVQKGRVVFQMLQLKGIIAHGWLVTAMVKNGSGYQISIVESNNPDQTIEFFYEEGDSYLIFSFEKGENYRFVPYTDYESDLNQMYKSMGNFCLK